MISEQEIEEGDEFSAVEEEPSEEEQLEHEACVAVPAEASAGDDHEDAFEAQALAVLEGAAARFEELAADEAATQEEIAEAQEGFEAFVSTLVTMREAKVRTAEQRKQRGYGNPGSGFTASGGFDKSKATCWDCGARTPRRR